MLRTDHCYPPTVHAPLGPPIVDHHFEAITMPAPLPPTIEPLAPSRPAPFTDPAAYEAWAREQSCVHCGASFKDRPRGADGLPLEVWFTENDCGCRKPEVKRKLTAEWDRPPLPEVTFTDDEAEWLWRDQQRARARVVAERERDAVMRQHLEPKPLSPKWRLACAIGAAMFAVGYYVGRLLP